MRITFFFFLSFFLSLSLGAQVDTASYNPIQTIEDAIVQSKSLAEKTYKKNNYPGLAIAVSVGGVPVFADGIGYADVEKQIAVDPYHSKFRIGSISKTLTAIALQQLVEERKINLDHEVQTYVDYFPKKKYPLTVRQAASHTGGVRHYKNQFEMMSNVYYPTVREGMEIFMADDLLFEPGSKYSYSSYGWNLISAIIEEAADVPFLDYMQLNVFDAFDLKETMPEVRNDLPNGLVSFYYTGIDKKPVLAPDVDNSYKWAGGGFVGTATDLLKFSHAVHQVKYLDQVVLAEFQTPMTLNDGNKTNYGLGWATNTDKKGRRWVGHSGGSVGGTSMYLYYPDYDLTVVTLVNLSSARMDQLAWKIAEQFFTVME